MSKQKENKWANYAFRIILNTASHPFEYAKLLIQIGYEPIEPRQAKTFFGKPALKLPNIFEYVRHIKSVDGFAGLYTGLAPKVCGNLVSAVATQKFVDYLQPTETHEDSDEYEDHEPEEEDKKKQLIKSLKCDILSHTAAIVVSHPFHVITIRMMAQFVGRESTYNGVISSVKEIYHQNGILGFFSGLVPRIVGDICSIVLASSLTFAIDRYLDGEKDLKVYTSATMSFIATAITYPFQVVSHCMAITNSGLAAGSPPHMPHYKSWIDCWVDLSQKNQLKRGSSLIVRYYAGPTVVIGGKAMALQETISPVAKLS